MRKFTDEELRLAPAVAEVMGLGLEIECPFQWRNYVRIALEVRDNYIVAIDAEYAIDEAHRIPLEHDCLEFLREHDFAVFTETFPSGESNVHVCGPGTDIVERGNWTLLEALYRVIIECGQKQGKGE